MPQEGVDRGRAAPERAVERRGVLAPSALEDAVAELVTGRTVEHAPRLELRERVGGEHLGPLVRIVPRCVAAREDVAEAVLEAVPGWWNEERDLAPDAIEAFLHGLGAPRLEGGVQAHVEERE